MMDGVEEFLKPQSKNLFRQGELNPAEFTYEDCLEHSWVDKEYTDNHQLVGFSHSFVLEVKNLREGKQSKYEDHEEASKFLKENELFVKTIRETQNTSDRWVNSMKKLADMKEKNKVPDDMKLSKVQEKSNTRFESYQVQRTIKSLRAHAVAQTLVDPTSTGYGYVTSSTGIADALLYIDMLRP